MSRGRFHPIWQDDRLYLFISDLVDGVFSGQNLSFGKRRSGPWKETDRSDAADIGLRGNSFYRYVRSGEQYIEIGTNTYYLWLMRIMKVQDKIQD